MTTKILIVDDEPNVRLMYRAALESDDNAVYEADSGPHALDQCAAREHEVAILDLRMPGMDGLELLEKMRDRKVNTPTIFISAHGEVPDAVRAMKLGAIDFLQKPILPDQLRNIVKQVLHRHKAGDSQGEPEDCDSCIEQAKRAINLGDFGTAKRHLIKALDINPDSPQAFNLVGVMLEMRDEYDQAKRYYGQAIKCDKNFEPARQNMRRIFDLFHFGSSKEPLNIEAK